MTVVLFAALALAFGPVVLPYLLLQAVIGFSLLEVVNYLEHYGLLRQKTRTAATSAACPSTAGTATTSPPTSSSTTCSATRDHHANPTRRYQALRHVDEAPQLPTGYAGMIVLAWFPPLWRRVMDPRLIAHYDGDVTSANIQPRKRGRMLARYGAAGDERLALPRAAATSTTRRRATPARASRPGRRGARSPTTGPARTAASATRSTSSPRRR